MAKGILADITVDFLKADVIAGSASKSTGYIVLSIRKRLYLAHRLAWLYVYGSWPLRTIDHINGCKTDNRIQNLRDVEHCENLRNRGEQTNNKSGASGVRWRKSERRWYTDAKRGGNRIYIGKFADLSDAIKARKEWEINNPVESTSTFLRQGITLNGVPV